MRVIRATGYRITDMGRLWLNADVPPVCQFVLCTLNARTNGHQSIRSLQRALQCAQRRAEPIALEGPDDYNTLVVLLALMTEDGYVEPTTLRRRQRRLALLEE